MNASVYVVTLFLIFQRAEHIFSVYCLSLLLLASSRFCLKINYLPILFLIDPEKVHNIIFSSLKILLKVPFVKLLVSKVYLIEDSRLEKTLFGIKFKNPVGLAAGFDKNAELYKELSSFGFGFIAGCVPNEVFVQFLAQ